MYIDPLYRIREEKRERLCLPSFFSGKDDGLDNFSSFPPSSIPFPTYTDGEGRVVAIGFNKSQFYSIGRSPPLVIPSPSPSEILVVVGGGSLREGYRKGEGGDGIPNPVGWEKIVSQGWRIFIFRHNFPSSFSSFSMKFRVCFYL